MQNTENIETFVIIVVIIVAIIFCLTVYFMTQDSPIISNSIEPNPLPPPPTPPPRKNRIPIIVIPGLGGTNLDFSIDENFSSPACNNVALQKLNNVQPSLWINPIGLLLQKDCFLTMLKPVYDKIQKTLTNLPGLKVFPRENYLGDPLNSFCLGYLLKSNSICYPATEYSKNFINFFVSQGYTKGVDLFTVGYDFRLVPYKQYGKEYFNQIQDLVEQTYEKTGKRISLVGHSLGTQLANIFLNRMDCKWKECYIENFISISPSYDGGPKSLRTCLSGYDFGLPDSLKLLNKDFNNAQRSISGLISSIPLLPKLFGPTNCKGEGNGEAVTILNNCLTSHPNCKEKCILKKTYNVNDYCDGIIGVLRALAIDTNTPELNTTADILTTLAKMRKKYAYTDPNVKVYQIMARPIPTESSYVYDITNEGLNSDPIFTTQVIGDHDIPVYGARIPYLFKWKNFTDKIFPPINGLDHYTAYVDSQTVYNYILNIVSEPI